MDIHRLAADRPANHGFITQILSTRSARQGGIVRRSVRSVDQEVGRDLIFQTMKSRGFHVVEVAGQYVIICSSGDLVVHF